MFWYGKLYVPWGDDRIKEGVDIILRNVGHSRACVVFGRRENLGVVPQKELWMTRFFVEIHLEKSIFLSWDRDFRRETISQADCSRKFVANTNLDRVVRTNGSYEATARR